MGDFNAHHPMFDNSSANRPNGDLKGRTMASLVIKTYEIYWAIFSYPYHSS